MPWVCPPGQGKTSRVFSQLGGSTHGGRVWVGFFLRERKGGPRKSADPHRDCEVNLWCEPVDRSAVGF